AQSANGRSRARPATRRNRRPNRTAASTANRSSRDWTRARRSRSPRSARSLRSASPRSASDISRPGRGAPPNKNVRKAPNAEQDNAFTPRKFATLADSQGFVGLQAQLPLRMREAIGNRARGVVGDLRPVHRLERKTANRKPGETSRRGARLRIDQLEFVARADAKLRSGFRADANPIQPRRRRDRAVGFHRDPKSPRVQRGEQRVVRLQQRLAAGEHDGAEVARDAPL